MKRRQFIQNSLTASLLLGSNWLAACQPSSRKLKILILGGTQFVGPATVKAALENGHEVTLFNRGLTNPDLFPELEWIKGDRTRGIQGYEGLENRKWDVAIDVWPEQSELVADATQVLAGKVDHYLFISSIAVYSNFQEVGLHEESEVVDLNIPKTDWDYAEEKLAAENIVRERFSDAHSILRPGPIKGWRDPAHDLLYWCVKLKRDDVILAPGSGIDPVQFIDVHDVGRMAIKACEDSLTGTYNCTGPGSKPLLWADFLPTLKGHLDSQTKLVWAPEDFLSEHEVYSFSDLPLWAPLSEDEGFMQISTKKMELTEFTWTPLSNTIDDCLKWHSEENEADFTFGPDGLGLGLSREKELALIDQLIE